MAGRSKAQPDEQSTGGHPSPQANILGPDSICGDATTSHPTNDFTLGTQRI